MRDHWPGAVFLIGLLGTFLALAVSVVILGHSVRAAAQLSQDRQAEVSLQEKMNLARWTEAKMLNDNLLRLRQMSRELDKLGAE